MPLRIGPLTIPWLGSDSAKDDPYWEDFLRRPAVNLDNEITEIIRGAPEGLVFPTKSDIHTPEIMSSHVKELAYYLRALLVGIAKLEADDAEDGKDGSFAVVVAVPAEQDPRTHAGIGGKVPVQNGLFVTFVLSAWIRELGFKATRWEEADAERLAAKAGLGTLNAQGRLVTRKYGSQIHVADVIRTDLPLAPDG